MKQGARLTVVGVDGLDFDVVNQIGPATLPTLHPFLAGSTPHASTFPPDSVPSWTTIVTGLAPEEHGQLKNADFLLQGDSARVEASLDPHQHTCFWEEGKGIDDIAVLNPFLAFPPWAPRGRGAMASGPSFAEEAPAIADPRSLLTGELPRMGGFASIPSQRHLEEFVEDTLAVGAAQFDYFLRQLESRRWDLVFVTNLTVDRIQHYAWRHFDHLDPTHPGAALAHLVPRAHQQVDEFLQKVLQMAGPDDAVALISDHGHGQRASIGVNLAEIFRQRGLLLLEGNSRTRRLIERSKNGVMAAATWCHAEESAVWAVRKLPGRKALKSGALAGTPRDQGVKVPDLAGSNPFGGISVGSDELMPQVLEILLSLEYHGAKVVKWAQPAPEVLTSGRNDRGLYPDLLFEFLPRFGPTWNFFGPEFSPIITHKIQSGGHTRRAVFATNLADPPVPGDSHDVHDALVSLVQRIS